MAECNEQFASIAKRRGVPFARIGMHVEMDGASGILVGSNGSDNFDVIFEDGRRKGLANCHPNWRIKYFDSDGKLIAEFGG